MGLIKEMSLIATGAMMGIAGVAVGMSVKEYQKQIEKLVSEDLEDRDMEDIKFLEQGLNNLEETVNSIIK